MLHETILLRAKFVHTIHRILFCTLSRTWCEPGEIKIKHYISRRDSRVRVVNFKNSDSDVFLLISSGCHHFFIQFYILLENDFR